MRVILGLAALAAVVNGVAWSGTGVIPSTFGSNAIALGSPPTAASVAFPPGAAITASVTTNGNFVQPSSGDSCTPSTSPSCSGSIGTATAPHGLNSGAVTSTATTWVFTVPNTVSTMVFQFNTNAYVAQITFSWFPNSGLSAGQQFCDPCSGGGTANTQNYLVTALNNAYATAGQCGTSGPSVTNSFNCASFARVYTFNGLQTSVLNSLTVLLYDNGNGNFPSSESFGFHITRSNPLIIGDPQIYGMQGQDFQVHGIPDEIFNLITYPNIQVNARFVYLSSGACHDNFTACFAHPGTYISQEGIRVGHDKVQVVAGSFKKGLTVSVNGVKVTDKKTSLKLGSVEMISHRRVVVKTPIMALTISNSDKFLNQETQLFDEKLLALGAERRTLLSGESFHSEVPLHGLQGQTWRNVEYASGLEYEGSISDYHVASGNLFGSDFVFNQYKQ